MDNAAYAATQWALWSQGAPGPCRASRQRPSRIGLERIAAFPLAPRTPTLAPRTPNRAKGRHTDGVVARRAAVPLLDDERALHAVASDQARRHGQHGRRRDLPVALVRRADVVLRPHSAA